MLDPKKKKTTKTKQIWHWTVWVHLPDCFRKAMRTAASQITKLKLSVRKYQRQYKHSEAVKAQCLQGYPGVTVTACSRQPALFASTL